MKWLPIPGFEGIYEVSDAGDVRSLDRYVTCRNGVRKFLRGRVLDPAPRHGYEGYALWRDGRQAMVAGGHQLVMLAFVGPRPDGLMVRHLDGDKTNNNLSNLAYGTCSENMFDRVRHGTHHNARKTHCARGHAFTPSNTRRLKGGRWRVCKTCETAGARAYYVSKRQSVAS